jgi:hypothetical protein
MFMTARRYDMSGNQRRASLPISAVIQAANRFGCDIFIFGGHLKFNVKDYNELQQGMQLQKRSVIFYFDGADEKEAENRFRVLLGI